MTRPSSTPDPSMYCRTCTRALQVRRHGDAGPVEYLHAADLRGDHTDHTPAPVPLAELPDAVQECDFDSATPAVFVYVCDEQVTAHSRIAQRIVGQDDYLRRGAAARSLREVTEHMQTHHWGQRWAACEGCAALIEARDLLGLIRRVTDGLPARMLNTPRKLRAVRGELDATYSHVFATLRPGRLRITTGNPLGIPDDASDPGDH